jgi:branched-chain amino acid transport system substrate-binding protein
MKEYKFTAESAPDFVVGPDNFTFPVIQYISGASKTVWPAAMRETDIQIPDYANK